MAKQPINPRMLSWSMESSGLDATMVAKATSRTVEDVQAWLAGEAPHRGDVAKLAKLFGRSQYFFNLPEPPTASETPPSFRYLEADAPAHASELAEIRWARGLQRQMEVLLEGEDVELPPDYSRERDPEAAAAKARDWLGWSTSLQRKATSKIGVFKGIRRAIENREIVVLLRSTKESSFAGFSLLSRLAPVIYLNKSYELGSLGSFTLLHELAHITRRDSEFCNSEDFWSEVWCNRFASAFLLPEQDVRNYFDRQRLAFTSPTDAEPVRRVSNYFKVSWAAAAVRLERLELAPKGLANHVISTRPEPRDTGFPPGGGQQTPQLRVEEYGRHYTSTMLLAAGQDRLQNADLKRRLRVKEDQLASLRSAVHE